MAKLRGLLPKVVLAANKAGFNIGNDAVLAFLYKVAVGMASGMASDSGSRTGTTRDAGELDSSAF